MSAGINIGVATSQAGGSISPDPFQVAYSELWGQLSGNFVALLSAMGAMETQILQDWGKMQATYQCILSTGPNTLAWPTTLTSTLVSNSVPGYTISAMQMLLPAKYQIFQYQENNSSSVPKVPSSAQWVQSIGNNKWNKYWIATPGNWDEYPSDEAMSDVWNAGATQSDFFQGLNGWGFARCYPAYEGSPIGTDCNGMVITVTNYTPNPLVVAASPYEGEGEIIGSSSQTLQPYGSVTFVSYYTTGLAIDVTVSDQNLGASPTVGAFRAHQHNCVLEGADVWVDNIWTGTWASGSPIVNYSFTTPICNTGAYGDSYPGTVQVGICLAQINPPASS